MKSNMQSLRIYLLCLTASYNLKLNLGYIRDTFMGW